jgi:hypothetical protein
MFRHWPAKHPDRLGLVLGLSAKIARIEQRGTLPIASRRWLLLQQSIRPLSGAISSGSLWMCEHARSHRRPASSGQTKTAVLPSRRRHQPSGAIAKNKDSTLLPPDSESGHTASPPHGGSIAPLPMTMTPWLGRRRDRHSLFCGTGRVGQGHSVCIVDETGKIVREVRVASEPEALLPVLKKLAYPLKRNWTRSGTTVAMAVQRSRRGRLASDLRRDAAYESCVEGADQQDGPQRCPRHRPDRVQRQHARLGVGSTFVAPTL